MIAIRPLIGQTIQAPSQAAKFILSLPLSNEVAWTGFALVQVLSAMVSIVQSLLFALMGSTAVFYSAVEYLAANVVIQLLTVAALTGVGRWLGGIGSYVKMLIAITWVGFIQTLLGACVVFVAFLLPRLSDFLSLIVLLGAFYLLVHFIQEVHQFDSIWRAVGAFMLVIASICLVITLFLQSIMIGL